MYYANITHHFQERCVLATCVNGRVILHTLPNYTLSFNTQSCVKWHTKVYNFTHYVCFYTKGVYDV